MKTFYTKIAEHVLQVMYEDPFVLEHMAKSFWIEEGMPCAPDLVVSINTGYGQSFKNYEVKIAKTRHTIQFSRADYEIWVDSEYRIATIWVHDDLALKHALTNLYSSFIVKQNWGLLVHSSCILEEGSAHLFAGHSGAGKSTAARLSAPRELLSDEATLIKVQEESVTVFNSPFRSDIPPEDCSVICELASIQLLVQSPLIKRELMTKSDAYLQLIDKVFYWDHGSVDTHHVLEMLQKLVKQVPVYRLEFQKNDLFWGLITNDSVYSK